MEANKIIITGGATRIGAAIAKKLSGPNKEILIHYNKSKAKAEKLKKELEKLHPYDVPEIAEINVESINQPYLEWLKDSTA